MNNNTYKLKIAGLERELQKFAVSDKMDIAAFILFGDDINERTEAIYRYDSCQP